LQQVLLNLTMNACEAMSEIPPGERRLTIETQRVGGVHVQVSVADCGPGFAPDALPRIFEPFRTTKTNGLGLGLPICRSIISAHGGRLWAVNNHDRGATLSFTLAAQKEPTQ
jgi:signal transduction histidine kinase